MWHRSPLILLACALPAQANFLDRDFWCQTFGCAVVHDGQTFDVYDVWQFDTNSCCVPVGTELSARSSRVGVPLVTGTLDRATRGPGAGESLMLEIVEGETVYSIFDDGDGYLDASDNLGAFALSSETDLRIAGAAQRYSHSFYVTSRNVQFSLRALAQIAASSGDFEETIGLGDIKLTPSLSTRGNDGGWEFGRRARRGNVTIVSGIDDLGDLSSGPTQIMDFGHRSGIAKKKGDLNDHVIRLDFLYELPDYDMSMGTGSLDVDVEFTFHRE